jgi:PAS domain S-box-containing protein
VSARLRQLAPVGLVLGLTVAGVLLARAFGEMDARRDSTHRADIAATQVRDSVAQASTLADGVRRFLVGPVSPTKEFTDVGGWLSLVGLPAAAWVEPVPSSQRVAYERRVGHRILEATPSGGLAPAAPRTSYLPATLTTGVPPMGVEGIDLGNTPGVAAAVARPQTAYRVSATSLGTLPDGTRGLFLVQSAQRLSRGVVEPGYVVLFVPASWLLAAAANAESSTPSSPELRITVGSTSAGTLTGAATVRSTFAAAGQRFAVEVPRGKVHGAAQVLPWIILAGGLALATLAGALRVIATRRAKAKAEVDRLFTLSPDLIVVAGFDGYFKRVNPAFQTRLGYTEDEALARPYLEFVHPDDRERTTAEADRLSEGEPTLSFENRYVCKDGSYRWIEWTATPVIQERLIYAVARDVTERRQAESKVERLAEEQAALHRVATLVARGVPPEELFAAVTEEAGLLLSVEYASLARYEPEAAVTTVAFWGRTGRAAPVVGRRIGLGGKNVATIVFETGRPARIDRYVDASGQVAEVGREFGIGSAAGTPVVVEGRLWGVMGAYSAPGQALPADIEARLANFSELLATAIANAESRAGLARLAVEQAALRRIATLVAHSVPPEEVFAAVTEEVGQLLPVSSAAMGRYDPDGMFTTVAAWSTEVAAFPVGKRWVPEGKNAMTMVFETGRPARIDNFADASGPVGVAARAAGYRSAVGTPITVEGRLWGVMTAASTAEEALPSDTEARLASFTELVATAIANAESRAGLARLAEEQAALRRVATLVAEGVPPEKVFSTLCEEVNRLLDSQATTIGRLEQDGRVTVVAISGTAADKSALGARLELKALPVSAAVIQTGRSARMDNYAHAAKSVLRDMGIRSGVGAPIVVEGALWGTIGIGTVRERFPDDTEQRLEKFTQLAATAIADAESRARLARLADEQAALRRVATLVAEGVQPSNVFSAVTEEVAGLFGSPAGVLRYDHDGPAVVFVNAWGWQRLFPDGAASFEFPIGTRWEFQDGMAAAEVYRTRRSARVDSMDWTTAGSGPVAAAARRIGVVSTVASPIVVEGRLWGVMTVSDKEPLPLDTEERLEKFTELVATAIANAETRSELAASRARIVAASDETRRRIERDLHDGTQQRLVSLGLALRASEAKVPPELDEVRVELSRTARGLADAVEDLQEISRGIHPAILSRGGLAPALETLAGRAALPVQLETRIHCRLPESVEVAAYYVVSEALTNAAKHARASAVQVELMTEDSIVELAIRDDGVGGADPANGSGLVGLRDRVEALGGTLQIASAPGLGTSLLARIPTDGVTVPP